LITNKNCWCWYCVSGRWAQ